MYVYHEPNPHEVEKVGAKFVESQEWILGRILLEMTVKLVHVPSSHCSEKLPIEQHQENVLCRVLHESRRKIIVMSHSGWHHFGDSLSLLQGSLGLGKKGKFTKFCSLTFSHPGSQIFDGAGLQAKWVGREGLRIDGHELVWDEGKLPSSKHLARKGA